MFLEERMCFAGGEDMLLDPPRGSGRGCALTNPPVHTRRSCHDLLLPPPPPSPPHTQRTRLHPPAHTQGRPRCLCELPACPVGAQGRFSCAHGLVSSARVLDSPHEPRLCACAGDPHVLGVCAAGPRAPRPSSLRVHATRPKPPPPLSSHLWGAVLHAPHPPSPLSWIRLTTWRPVGGTGSPRASPDCRSPPSCPMGGGPGSRLCPRGSLRFTPPLEALLMPRAHPLLSIRAGSFVRVPYCPPRCLMPSLPDLLTPTASVLRPRAQMQGRREETFLPWTGADRLRVCVCDWMYRGRQCPCTGGSYLLARYPCVEAGRRF